MLLLKDINKLNNMWEEENPLFGSNQPINFSGGVGGGVGVGSGVNGGMGVGSGVSGDIGVGAEGGVNGGGNDWMSNPLVGQIGGAAMGIGSELLRENNDSYYDQSGVLPSFVGLIGHSNQDVNVNDTEFDRNIYQQNYQAEENPYSKDAGSIAKRIGHTTLNDAGRGLQYGGLHGAIGGAVLGLGTGIAGEFINKRKNQEFEDEVEANKQVYKDQQMSFIGDRNDQIRNYAQQGQLANRGIPNYNTNAYNV